MRDPTVTRNKTLSIHRWVNWIAGFSADFVDSVLDRYLPAAQPGQALVLDPFAGVGTTNVQALRRGFHTYGFEVNPFAALAARCKLEAPSVDFVQLGRALERYETFAAAQEREIDNWWRGGGSNGQAGTPPLPQTVAPPFFRTREPFFSRPVELKVLATLDFISTIQNPAIKRYFQLALGSTLVSYSNYSYEPSLCSRRRLGKPLIENECVGRIVGAKLRQMYEDAGGLRDEIGARSVPLVAAVYERSFFQAAEVLAPQSIDLIITSPPYLNNYHYVRNSRPQLYWLGAVHRPSDLKHFEENSFGNFWQTVRGRPPIDLVFDLPDLADQLDQLRALHPDRGVYGGRGWANYAASYLNDSHRFIGLLANILRPGGHAVIVVGNSLLQGIEFRLDEILRDIGQLHGLNATVERIRSKRVGDSIVGTGLRQKPQNGRPELYEAAVVIAR